MFLTVQPFFYFYKKKTFQPINNPINKNALKE